MRALIALGLAAALAGPAYAQHEHHGPAAPAAEAPSGAPKVVSTFPPNEAVIPAGIPMISVTYDRAMMDKSWSFASGGESKMPQVNGGPSLDDDGRTFNLPVKLQANTTYVIWMNTDRFQNFKDDKGRAAEPYRLTFTTSE